MSRQASVWAARASGSRRAGGRAVARCRGAPTRARRAGSRRAASVAERGSTAGRSIVGASSRLPAQERDHVLELAGAAGQAPVGARERPAGRLADAEAARLRPGAALENRHRGRRSARLVAAGPVVCAVPKAGRPPPATRTAEMRATRAARPRQRPIVRRGRGDPFRREATRERSQTGALRPPLATSVHRAPAGGVDHRMCRVHGLRWARPRDAAPSSGRPADEGSAASTPPSSTRSHRPELPGPDEREAS